MNDDRLEELFRASLRDRADSVTADSALAQTARTSARRRQRVKVAVAGVAAAAVIAPIGVLAALTGADQRTVDEAGPATAGSGTTAPGSPATDATAGDVESPTGVPENWRVESYDGVQLRVPPDWGWGGVPMRDDFFGGGDGLLTCGRGAFAYPGPNGETLFEEEVDMPYVGRANYYMTDVCIGGRPFPDQPHVWLGSPLPVGSVLAKSGFRQETVEVGGVRVTVWEKDREELALILSTIEPVETDANGCAAVSTLPQRVDPLSSVGEVEAVSICVYRHTGKGAVFLGYSARIEGAAARRILAGIEAAPVVTVRCAAPVASLGLDDVLLRFEGPAQDADVLAQLRSCPGYYTGEAGVRVFTKANVDPWVVDGVGLYASGGQMGNALSGLFQRPGE